MPKPNQSSPFCTSDVFKTFAQSCKRGPLLWKWHLIKNKRPLILVFGRKFMIRSQATSDSLLSENGFETGDWRNIESWLYRKSYLTLVLIPKVNRYRLGIPRKSKQRQSASVTSPPGQNYRASLAVHGSDDITSRNIWSQVNSMAKCTPQVFNFSLSAQPSSTNFAYT